MESLSLRKRTDSQPCRDLPITNKEDDDCEMVRVRVHVRVCVHAHVHA